MVLYTTFVIIVLVTIQYTNGKMLPKSRLGFLCRRRDAGKHQTGQPGNQSSAEYEHDANINSCPFTTLKRKYMLLLALAIF